MPKTLSNKRAYDSGDGFVEDGAPKSKKARSEQKPLNKDTQRDNDGNAYWEVSLDALTSYIRTSLTYYSLLGRDEYKSPNSTTIPCLVSASFTKR